MQTVNWDADFETTVARFEEQSLAAQVRADTLHPFDRELFVSHLREQIKTLYKDLEKGYEILLRTVMDLNDAGVSLAGMPPLSKASFVSVKQLFPTRASIKGVSEEDVEDNWIENGVPLYHVLGLTSQAVSVMYEAACYLLQENRIEETLLAFRFILVLAPHMSDFWTGYGVAQMRANLRQEAICSLERAISLDPHSLQILLLLCRALAEANRKGEAEAKLNAKLDEAARQSDQARYEMLDAARYEIIRFVPKKFDG